MSSRYVLLTDSSCDLPEEYLVRNDISVVQLGVSLDGVEYKGDDLSPEAFYRQLRDGKMPYTTQVNQQEFIDYFTPYLDSGTDVLYIAFSSGLSGTCASAQAAAKVLSDQYPERKMYVVDSLCASLGQGLLLHKLNKKRKEGASLDEIRDHAEDIKLKVGHSFTVPDLMHLHRGGRVSKASAIAGSLLGIRPVLHVDNEGRLTPTGKVRGEKQALTRVVDQMEKWVGNTQNDIFMISHGDDIESANIVAEMVKERLGIKEVLINYVGTVIGTHSGPGTIALFMMVDER